MPLSLYRRHTRRCPYHAQPRTTRSARACPQRCPIWVQGTLAHRHVRQSLGLRYWEPAARLITEWELAGDFDGRLGDTAPRRAALVGPDDRPATSVRGPVTSTPAPPATRAPVVTAVRAVGEPAPPITIRDAIARFLTALETQNLSHETIRKYRTLLPGRLVRWCETVRVTRLAELTVTQMDAFRATWTDSPLYALKNLDRLRAFFAFCVDREWIAKNSAKAVKAPQVDVTPTLPFTEAEVDRMLAACQHYRGNQRRVRAFILVMRYAGLRISDAIALHANQRVGNNLRLYTTKTGQPVFVPLPPVVVEALRAIEVPNGRYFTTGKGKLATGRANWSRYLARIFDLAGIEGGRSHRFRDTFSTSLLEQGVSVEDVAMLLGNTPAIVVKHYAPWIQSRQRALTAAVQTMWPSAGRPGEANDDAACVEEKGRTPLPNTQEGPVEPLPHAPDQCLQRGGQGAGPEEELRDRQAALALLNAPDAVLIDVEPPGELARRQAGAFARVGEDWANSHGVELEGASETRRGA